METEPVSDTQSVQHHRKMDKVQIIVLNTLQFFWDLLNIPYICYGNSLYNFLLNAPSPRAFVARLREPLI
jgi:hypothetical protein